jgi:hypothetical protein
VANFITSGGRTWLTAPLLVEEHKKLHHEEHGKLHH